MQGFLLYSPFPKEGLGKRKGQKVPKGCSIFISYLLYWGSVFFSCTLLEFKFKFTWQETRNMEEINNSILGEM